MKEFWWTFFGGAAATSPIAYLIGRWGLVGLLDRLKRFFDDPPPEHPAMPPRSHVHVIREEGGQ